MKQKVKNQFLSVTKPGTLKRQLTFEDDDDDDEEIGKKQKDMAMDTNT